jgi:hypothetical protein
MSLNSAEDYFAMWRKIAADRFATPAERWTPKDVREITQRALAKHGEDAANAAYIRLREVEREHRFLRACVKAMRRKRGQGWRQPVVVPLLKLVLAPEPHAGD